MERGCLEHNASAEVVRIALKTALDGSSGGLVQVSRIRSETGAPNDFLYFLDFFETGNIATTNYYELSYCTTIQNIQRIVAFATGQAVLAISVRDGKIYLYPTSCDMCVDGIIQRGDLITFEVPGGTF